jgi:hypothetical protein
MQVSFEGICLWDRETRAPGLLGIMRNASGGDVVHGVSIPPHDACIIVEPDSSMARSGPSRRRQSCFEGERIRSIAWVATTSHSIRYRPAARRTFRPCRAPIAPADGSSIPHSEPHLSKTAFAKRRFGQHLVSLNPGRRPETGLNTQFSVT